MMLKTPFLKGIVEGLMQMKVLKQMIFFFLKKTRIRAGDET